MNNWHTGSINKLFTPWTRTPSFEHFLRVAILVSACNVIPRTASGVRNGMLWISGWSNTVMVPTVSIAWCIWKWRAMGIDSAIGTSSLKIQVVMDYAAWFISGMAMTQYFGDKLTGGAVRFPDKDFIIVRHCRWRRAGGGFWDPDAWDESRMMAMNEKLNESNLEFRWETCVSIKDSVSIPVVLTLSHWKKLAAVDLMYACMSVWYITQLPESCMVCLGD